MKPTQKLLTRVGVIVMSMFVMPTLVHANIAEEPSSSVFDAQVLGTSSGDLNVSGYLTLGAAPRGSLPTRDQDFYSFFAFAGDTIAMAVSGDVNTSVALFGLAPSYALVATGDASSRINGQVIAESGMYTVAVANSGAFFSDGGTVDGGAYEQGGYSLSVSGMSMASMEIDIDVKPRRHKVARINLKKKRSVKVAILGGPDFDVAKIDRDSLTFGATGKEYTLRKCKRRLKDVNRDGMPDLVCKFRLKGTNFEADSTKAYLSGETEDGWAFHGSDDISVKKHRKLAHRSKR
jgi:hypothetical protein